MSNWAAISLWIVKPLSLPTPVFLYLLYFILFYFFATRSFYEAQAGLEFTVLLQPLHSCVYRCAPPRPAPKLCHWDGLGPGASHMPGKLDGRDGIPSHLFILTQSLASCSGWPGTWCAFSFGLQDVWMTDPNH